MPSPYAYTVYTSTTSGQTDFQFTWPYIKEEHVKLYVNYNEISQGSGSSQFQVITNVSPKLVRLNTGLGSANLRVEVRRISSLDTPLVDYADGSTLTATDLDTSSLQSLYIAQELDDNQSRNVAIDTSTALPSLNNQRLTNVSNPTAAQDAATKSYVDTNDALQLSRSGGTMTGDIVTGGNRITGLPNPASASEPVTKSYFEGQSWSGSDTLESTDTWASNNSKIATTGAIDGRIDSVIESDVLAGTDLAKTASGGQVTINHSVSGANSTVNNSDGNVLQDITISAQGHVTAIGSANLDSRYYTETELSSGGVLDGRYYTKTSADSTFYKLGSAGEIQSGETWSSSDSKVATTAAIDARITDLVDDVGGFVPIASETNFPTANPDVNNGAGTLLSIKEIGTTRTPSGGTVTIANGSGSNTVTITGCGSTVLTAGFGIIVETTSTLHTYTFHRLTPKATEVTTVAGISANITTVAGNTTNINSVASNATNINSVAGISSNVTTVAGISSNVTSVAGNATNINAVNSNSTNINLVAGSISNVNTVGGSIANVNTVATNISGVNSFGERYRIASSDPTSDLDEGDLVFNTTTNQLRVYNGSAWQGGVTATGDLIAKTGDTFSGAIGIIAGSTGSPGLYISGDTDTGIHSPGANTIALIASGSNILQAGSSGITVNGTATATAFSGPLTGNVTGTASGNAVLTGSTNNTIATVTGANALAGEANLTYDGTRLNVATGDLQVIGAEGGNAEFRLVADEGDDGQDYWRLQSNASSNNLNIATYASGSWADKVSIDTNGVCMVGLSSALSSNNARLQVAHTDGNADIIVHRAGNNSNPPALNFQKTRNASIGNYGTVVQDGDELGSIRWGGADGSDIAFAARIVGSVDGTPGSNDMPGRLTFHTSGDGNENLNERMRIDSSGRLLIGVTSSTSVGGEHNKLQIEGTTAPTSNVSLTRNSNDAGGCFLKFGKSRGTSTGSNTIVQSGDTIGGLVFNAADGVDKDISAASITAHIDGTPGADDLPGRLVFKTTVDGAASATERMRIDSSGKIGIGTSSPASYYCDQLVVDIGSNVQSGITIVSETDKQGQLAFADGTGGDARYRGYIDYHHNTDRLSFGVVGQEALAIDSSRNATFAGTVSDSKGNLRSIPNDTKTSAYTLVASDAGKCIRITTGGVTVPNSVFAEGDAVTIINQSGSDQTITAGSGFTLYNSGDGSAGSKTLAGRGMATLMFAASDAAYMSGAGLS